MSRTTGVLRDMTANVSVKKCLWTGGLLVYLKVMRYMEDVFP